MMKGIEFDTALKQIRVRDGERLVSTTDGTLVCLLPDLVEIDDISVEMPDGQYKDVAYWFKYDQQRAFVPGPPVDQFLQRNWCQTFFARRPEEFLASQNLVAVPAGADIFVGQVRLTRTTSPSHTWAGDTLHVLPKPDQWVPLTGSILLEAGLGLARALHIYPEDGQLKLKRQMSIGPAAGGYGTQGSFGSPASSVDGLEVLYDVGEGVLVWTSTSSPYRKFDSREVGTDSPIGPSDFLPLRWGPGGSNPCSRTDPTDYTSVYSVDVRGYFGRRS